MEQNLAVLIQAVSERQQSAERQLSELSAIVTALQARIAELGKPPGPPAAATAVPPTPESPKKAQVTPDILLMLAAAATAFLGKEVRIRSARKLQSPYGFFNPWAQQGRVSIQGSHSLRLRR